MQLFALRCKTLTIDGKWYFATCVERSRSLSTIVIAPAEIYNRLVWLGNYNSMQPCILMPLFVSLHENSENLLPDLSHPSKHFTQMVQARGYLDGDRRTSRRV